jgi:hypothetical protein
MGQAGAVMVTLRLQKHLGFMHQPAEGFTMDDSVNIPLIAGAHILFPIRFKPGTALARVGKGGLGIEFSVFLSLQFFPNGHTITPLFICLNGKCPVFFSGFHTLHRAGGLVRAYTKGAKIAIDAAGKSMKRVWSVLYVPCPYTFYERVKLEVAAFGGVIRDTQFGAEVELELLFPEAQAQPFLDRLTDMTAATVEGMETGKEYRAFPI